MKRHRVLCSRKVRQPYVHPLFCVTVLWRSMCTMFGTVLALLATDDTTAVSLSEHYCQGTTYYPRQGITALDATVQQLRVLYKWFACVSAAVT
jgi:hypothetical protein